jgi:hypothetical protein
MEPVYKEEHEREQELANYVRNLDYKFCGIHVARNHFSNYARRTENDPVVLILDNHMPHCSLETFIYCTEHYLVLLSSPATSTLQP